MTEYDYSPDAVERYMKKQNSVARWVDRQAQEVHNYRNPFVPDASPAPPTRSNSGDRAAAGAALPRSVSTPPDPRHAQARAYGHGHSQRSGGHRSHTTTNSGSTTLAAQSRYNSAGLGSTSQHSHSRSHSASQTPVYATSRPPHARSRTVAHAMNMANASASATYLPAHGRSPTRSHTYPAQPQFTAAPGQPVIMQNGRQTYVLVPPSGSRIQLCSPQTTSPTYATAPQGYVPANYPYGQPVSPTRTASKKPPLLKRLFGFPGNNSHGHADVHSRRSGNAVPASMDSAGARRRTTSMHY